MKIKPPSRRHLERSRRRKESFHWWLVDERPKKSGRLGQLQKHNRRNRRTSEFVLMAEAIEAREVRW
jgi:hypothetical protein